jgi:hypothetical protein
MCLGTFEKCRSDEDALAECEGFWPGLQEEDRAIVCDECWKIVDPELEENADHYAASLRVLSS